MNVDSVGGAWRRPPLSWLRDPPLCWRRDPLCWRLPPLCWRLPPLCWRRPPLCWRWDPLYGRRPPLCWDYDDEVEGETKNDHGAYCNAVFGSRMGLSAMMIGKQVVTKRSVGYCSDESLIR